ncbi:HD domain-containing protein [Aliiroseovarius sp.]|uniref:HD domain-containing protein n=1 Tax=Aliiroseovarius sp. TaxID=1872442 RepID=UPI002634BF0A|nr:HD domain-containing protein [Aliiroseovarius sp.]
MAERLTRQLAFLTEADRLKLVNRSNVLMDGSRQENSAEHSWHLALFALTMADHAPGVDIGKVLSMCLLHDLVEIDAGDHPIHEDFDAAEVARNEQRAADRLFGILPDDQGAHLRAIWEEFEGAASPEAAYAKRVDFIQPVFQVLLSTGAPDWHFDIARDNLKTGRTAPMADTWPALHGLATRLLDGPADIPGELRFLAEADRLKTVTRATPILSAARRENSAEHSWHLMLFALILAEQAAPGVDITRVMMMLLLHDLVEIDAGDVPVHGQVDHAAIAVLEQAAADRLFGLLPEEKRYVFRSIWEEFEAAKTSDAVFAKSLDRVQPVMANLVDGGGSWIEYSVTRDQLETRVGIKVKRGAPAVWEALRPRIDAWFASHAATG